MLEKMKLIYVDRKTKLEKRYSKKMGILSSNVTYIRKKVLGIPLKPLHKYRETYYGSVKDCTECKLYT